MFVELWSLDSNGEFTNYKIKGFFRTFRFFIYKIDELG